jgi:hypothetical protein
MNVILAAWEAEKGRIVVWGQRWLGREISETPSQPKAGQGGMHLLPQAEQEAEIGRITVPGVPGQPRQKRSWDTLPSS